jgi:hypothetical protein
MEVRGRYGAAKPGHSGGTVEARKDPSGPLRLGPVATLLKETGAALDICSEPATYAGRVSDVDGNLARMDLVMSPHMRLKHRAHLRKWARCSLPLKT